MVKIMFVCLGNICRSPMAEFIMRDLVTKKGEADSFYIRSSATGTWENGNPVHYGTKKILDRLNISCVGKYSELLRKSDYDKFDYFIGMDEYNRRDMLRIFGSDPQNKISLLLDYTKTPRAVKDPYYTGDFESTYQDVVNGTQGLYEHLKSKN
ncbi:MAG: low molecular weight phosphotyrosine protein phosphatase [Clostridiales bacterium]|nr:low molecular weight phosphotyrosine protein phosphatase [Clostridiales bacterium]